MVKIFSNLATVGIVLMLIWSIFYFRLFPRFIKHFKKVVERRRVYEKELEAILKEPEDSMGEPPKDIPF